MKPLITLLLMMALLIGAGTASAQVDGTFKVRPAMFAEEGLPAVFGVTVGGNLNIYHDSTSGFTTFTEQGALFSNRENPDEREGAYFIAFNGISKRDLLFGLDAYIALGLGDMHIFRSGGNLDLTIIAADGGIGISRVFAVGAFGWYTPTNRGITYGLNLSIMPWF